eukprot:3559947-Prymnesium_polylepis.3
MLLVRLSEFAPTPAKRLSVSSEPLCRTGTKGANERRGGRTRSPSQEPPIPLGSPREKPIN